MRVRPVDSHQGSLTHCCEVLRMIFLQQVLPTQPTHLTRELILARCRYQQISKRNCNLLQVVQATVLHSSTVCVLFLYGSKCPAILLLVVSVISDYKCIIYFHILCAVFPNEVVCCALGDSQHRREIVATLPQMSASTCTVHKVISTSQ